MKNVITVKDLAKKYQLKEKLPYYSLRDSLVSLFGIKLNKKNSFWALKNISFEIPQGEVVGIIGPNGAGKSTLLKILSQITLPTRGEAVLEGKVASLIEVGTGFHPELTGQENIYLSGALLGMSRQETKTKFKEIVEFAQVEKFLDTPLKHYSSGMYNRLGFAVAANLDAEILLIDEALAVGDIGFQQKSFNKIRNISQGGKTILLVSHDLNAVQRLCSYCIYLDKGRIVKKGQDVKKIVYQYLNDQTQKTKFTLQSEQRPWFKPLIFFLNNKQGKILNNKYLPADEEIWIQIEAEIEKVDPTLTMGYALYYNEQLLYWSYFTDSFGKKIPQLKTGKLTLKSQIPPRLLNEGRFKVELIGGLHSREWLFEPGVNAPAIYFEIKGSLSQSPYWINKRPGLLAPILDWQIKQ